MDQDYLKKGIGESVWTQEGGEDASRFVYLGRCSLEWWSQKKGIERQCITHCRRGKLLKVAVGKPEARDCLVEAGLKGRMT